MKGLKNWQKQQEGHDPTAFAFVPGMDQCFSPFKTNHKLDGLQHPDSAVQEVASRLHMQSYALLCL